MSSTYKFPWSLWTRNPCNFRGVHVNIPFLCVDIADNVISSYISFFWPSWDPPCPLPVEQLVGPWHSQCYLTWLANDFIFWPESTILGQGAGVGEAQSLLVNSPAWEFFVNYTGEGKVGEESCVFVSSTFWNLNVPQPFFCFVFFGGKIYVKSIILTIFKCMAQWH